MDLVIDFFLITGIVISVIILLLLIKSTKKELPQKLLIVFFTILLCYIVHAYSDVHDIEILWIVTFVFNDALELVVGPILLLYVKSLFLDTKELVKRNWVHFIPLVGYFFLISLPMLLSIVQKSFVFNYLKLLNDNSLWMFTFFIALLIVYMLWALKLFLTYRNIVPLNFSTIPKSDLSWVRNMLVGSIIVASVSLLMNVRDIITGNQVDTDWIILILVTIFIAYLGYYGVKQTKMLLPDFLILESNTKKNKLNNTSRYSYDENELKQLKKMLLSIVNEQKVYLDEDLTLNKLAQQIPTTDKKLSTLLNQYMKTTFYDFVNKHRVESVKEKLKSNDFAHLTILGIAYESGFNSKTSFNRIFKKETGLSPSEYKKLL